MLIYGLKLAILSAASIVFAALFSRSFFFTDVGKKVLLVWVSVLPFIFIVANETLTILASLGILLTVNRGNKPIIALVLFIAVLSAVPDWTRYIASAPGINYILTVTYDKVAVIAILLPILLNIHKIQNAKWNVTDTLVCLFVVLVTVLAFRDDNVTTVARNFVDVVLIYFIPYFVFSRVIKSVNDLHYCSAAFLMLSILLSAIYIASQALQLDIYKALDTGNVYNVIRERRGGFLRLAGPLIGILVSFILLAGCFSWDSIKKFGFLSKPLAWLMFASFGLSVLFSGSRGAFIGIFLGGMIYFYFLRLNSVQQILALVAGVVAVVIGALAGLFTGLGEDQYGTFSYRTELYKTSWEYLKIYPIFGNHRFMDSGFFDHLVTGIGIIDIVSAYLEVALKYGFVGLAIFVGMFASVLITLYKKLQLKHAYREDYFKYLVMYFSLLMVAVFMISTTSIISYFPVFLMVFLGIGRALCEEHNFQ